MRRDPKRRLRDAVGFAWNALWAHKTRTLLTALSMMIANASVIVVVSVALTGRDFVVAQIEGIGANLIYAYYEAGSAATAAEADYVTVADMDAVKAELADEITGAAAVMTIWDSVAVNGGPRQVKVLGTNEDYRVVRNIEVPVGRFLDAADMAERSKVCLVSVPLAGKLFGGLQSAVGQALTLQGLRFEIVGVFRESTDTFGQSEYVTDSALIPISVMRYFQRVERVDPLYVSVRDQANIDAVTAQVRQIIESRHRPGSAYKVENLTSILTAARQIALALTVVMLLVAAITLAISGVFIMNIMLISVSERTKEVGVRMALGATRREIRSQFLLEAVAISALGGLAGVLLGTAIPLMLDWLVAEVDVVTSPWSVLAAVVVSGTVGAVFGLLPASRAAELHPVEALRYE